MFVAVDLPPAVKEIVWSVAEAAVPSVPDARWVPRDNYHLTTKFLGHVPDERISAIGEAVARASGAMVAFGVRLGELGAFPSARRARVLWIGLEDPAGGFAAVASTCDEMLGALGFEPEKRGFTPHLTIARLRTPARVDLPAAEHGSPRFMVDRLTLFRSHLGRPAPRYEPLAIYPFGLAG